MVGVQVVVAVREVAQTQTAVAVDAVVVGVVVVDAEVAMEGEEADAEVVMEGEMAVEEEMVVVIAEMAEEMAEVVAGVVEVDVVEGGVEDVVSVLFSYDVPFPELLSTQVVVKFIGRSCTTEHCNIMKGPCEPCMRSEFYPIPGPGQRAMSGQRLDWEL